MLLINNLIKELDRPNGLILGLFYDTVDVTVNRMQFRPTKGCFISTECTDLPLKEQLSPTRSVPSRRFFGQMLHLI